MYRLIIAILFFTCFCHKLQADNIPPKVMLVIDTSSSMSCQDILPNRMQKSKELATYFVKKHPEACIGLTTFAGKWENICLPEQANFKTLLREIDKIKTDTIHDGTATGSALLSAAACLKNLQGNRTILLLTDDRENCGNISIRTAIEILIHYNIQLNIIAIGSNGIAPFPTALDGEPTIIDMPTTLDSPYLYEIASQTGGEYIEVSPDTDFQKMMQKLWDRTFMRRVKEAEHSYEFNISEEVMEWLIQKTLSNKKDIPFPR